MKITQLKQQIKQVERVSVFVDGKYSFSLHIDQLLDSGIKKGLPLTEEEIDKYKKLSQDGKLKQRCLEWLLSRPRSQCEFEVYLKTKKVDTDYAESLTSEFKSKGYLDDNRFAEWYAEQRIRKNKSAKELRYELKSKGIHDAILQQVVARIQNDEQSIKALITKLSRRSIYKDPKKLKSYLYRKGFSSELITESLQEVQLDD